MNETEPGSKRKGNPFHLLAAGADDGDDGSKHRRPSQLRVLCFSYTVVVVMYVVALSQELLFAHAHTTDGDGWILHPITGEERSTDAGSFCVRR